MDGCVRHSTVPLDGPLRDLVSETKVNRRPDPFQSIGKLAAETLQHPLSIERSFDTLRGWESAKNFAGSMLDSPAPSAAIGATTAFSSIAAKDGGHTERRSMAASVAQSCSQTRIVLPRVRRRQ